MENFDISEELWREYDFNGRNYRISLPIRLYWEEGHTCHRVLDGANVVHCVPAPGTGDCVLRWAKKDDSESPVNF